jgi:hypothetical protein
MPQYYKGNWEPSEPLPPGTIYNEVDETGYPVRQVEVYGDVWWASVEELDGHLGDQRLDTVELVAQGEVAEISREEFEGVWTEAVRRAADPEARARGRRAWIDWNRVLDQSLEPYV